MTTIDRVLGAFVLMTSVACAQRSVALAPDTMDELHAAVLGDADAVTGEALVFASRVPMDAPAVPEGVTSGPRAETTAAPPEEEAPAKAPEPSTDQTKAKSPPPTGPSGMRPPLSASEAAERADGPGQPAQAAPSSSASAPAPVSPKAPPELWNPPGPASDQRP